MLQFSCTTTEYPRLQIELNGSNTFKLIHTENLLSHCRYNIGNPTVMLAFLAKLLSREWGCDYIKDKYYKLGLVQGLTAIIIRE